MSRVFARMSRIWRGAWLGLALFGTGGCKENGGSYNGLDLPTSPKPGPLPVDAFLQAIDNEIFFGERSDPSLRVRCISERDARYKVEIFRPSEIPIEQAEGRTAKIYEGELGNYREVGTLETVDYWKRETSIVFFRGPATAKTFRLESFHAQRPGLKSYFGTLSMSEPGYSPLAAEPMLCGVWWN